MNRSGLSLFQLVVISHPTKYTTCMMSRMPANIKKLNLIVAYVDIFTVSEGSRLLLEYCCAKTL